MPVKGEEDGLIKTPLLLAE